MNGYAVVDLETTGLRPGGHDRVVEVGVVLLSPTGEVEDTWSTLVNPERDLGPQDVHGIRAADVLAAPTFADLAGTLTTLLRGRTFVAHNARFDAGFLTAAYLRVGHAVPLTAETTLCTLRWAGRLLPQAPRTLAGCCASVGVPLEHHHSALADATAAAGLLRHYLELAGLPRADVAPGLGAPGRWTPPWWETVAAAERAAWPAIPDGGARCVVRGNATEREVPFLSRLVDSLVAVPGSEAQTDYLALLDHALMDRVLSVREQQALVATAHDLAIDQPTAIALHRAYLRSLARAAIADGVVSAAEREDLHAVASLLDLDPAEVDGALDAEAGAGVPPPLDDAALAPTVEHFRLAPGDKVVFTGEMAEPREVWQARAAAAGLVPHPNVTKQVRLVVAADPDSLSGKARKAAGYGIPIVTEAAFGRMLAAALV
ncbi:exonuclease domain-containing protein [Georgenia ruanii]|nr:exonuclease domain-containing protein [Georgenia ruanii]MPV89193.1 DNA polymerase III subunit epsilon [Georgenia ruanii]